MRRMGSVNGHKRTLQECDCSLLKPLVSDTMKALVAWSSGKDSAWALHEARRSGNFEMVGALDNGHRRFRPREHAWYP